MIKVKHPNEEMNRNQEQFIASCPPDQGRFHELMFIHGNITFRYHSDAQRYYPTQEDYERMVRGTS